MRALIITLLLVTIGLLVYIAIRPTTLQTTPQPAPQEPIQLEPVQESAQEEPTPHAPVPERGEPTPRAPEPTKPGTSLQLQPDEALFWVNDIRVPSQTAYGYFIPVQDDDLKTFAGSFGPYIEDPTESLSVELCAEFTKVQAAPACEFVSLLFKNKYVSFARGYQFDEYIGGMAVKDYTAYYTVYANDKPIAHSNRAVVRTVRG